jgi:hypothetical protein
MGMMPQEQLDMALMGFDKQIMSLNDSMKGQPYDHEKFTMMQRLRRTRDKMAFDSQYYGSDPGNRRFNKQKEQKRLGRLAEQQIGERMAQKQRLGL